MDILTLLISRVNDVLWTYILIIMLLGCAFWFTFKTNFVQFRMIREMVRLLGDSTGKTEGREHHMSSCQAFAVSIASRIGTDQDGIDILDKKTGEVRQLRNKAGDERSLQNNTVIEIPECTNNSLFLLYKTTYFYYGLYILMLEFRQYRLHIAMHAPPYQMFLIPSCK